jgi:hypothetical protein
MKLSIMQPYFFPYLGYFQLINASDKFVVYDDVQFIKGGWINRNRILSDDSTLNIGIPIRKDSYKRNINERYYVDNTEIFKTKLLRQLDYAYRNAPFFKEAFPFITQLLSISETNVSKFNTHILFEICQLLRIPAQFCISSEIIKQSDLKGEGRVLYLNQVLGSEMYINPVGGTDLYRKESFLGRNIELKFLVSNQITYKQFGGKFISDLSIIDILMFNSPEDINKLLAQYQLQ